MRKRKQTHNATAKGTLALDLDQGVVPVALQLDDNPSSRPDAWMQLFKLVGNELLSELLAEHMLHKALSTRGAQYKRTMAQAKLPLVSFFRG